MNLYKVTVEHFSQKDSHRAIETFLLAEDDEAVYNWLDKKQYGIWSDRNDDRGLLYIYDESLNVIGQESYKEKMIRIKGELNDEDLVLGDLYYGKTIYGWEQLTDVMLETRVAALQGIGILTKI